MQFYGNKDILNVYKIGFLCSRKIPADIILKIYDWAIEQRNKGVCVVSGFHSKIEKDVFEILAKGKQPIILVLARGMMKRFDNDIQELLNSNRLLIISPFENNVKRPTIKSAMKRNEFIAEISDRLFIPFTSENGNLVKIKNHFSDKLI